MQNSVSQSNTAVVIHQPTCLPANAATNTKISPKMRGEESIKTKPSTHPGSKSSALSQCGKQLKALGPKSLAGKKKSARNAFKSGFYSKALLPWEDPKAQQTQWDALVAQWGAYDPTRVGLLHTYTFALLQQQRLMVIERDKIIGAMQSVDFAIEFCKRAGLPLTSFSALPVWFFHPDDDHEKTRALEVARIYEQATMLKESFSDRVVPQIQSQYPDLYRYVMRNQPVSHSFLIALGQQYRQQTPILNLGGLLNSLQQQYAKHLIWAEDPRRYQLIIDGLRAELIG
jgi:hypothetical protein